MPRPQAMKAVPAKTSSQNRKLRLIGEYMREIVADLIDVMGTKPLREIMTAREVQELVEAAKAEITGHHSHIYVDYFFWYAQKPCT